METNDNWIRKIAVNNLSNFDVKIEPVNEDVELNLDQGILLDDKYYLSYDKKL